MARVAFIVDDLFEDSEFLEPYRRVREAGHDPLIVGKSSGKEITGKNGATATVDKGSDEVASADFDAVIIPGGYSPDKVRTDPRLVSFTREMHDAGKPVAAICHGPWMLAEADVLHGRTVTSFHSVKTDLVNAGATWVDEEVVEDGNMITSRNPHDIPAFSDALLRRITQFAAAE